MQAAAAAAAAAAARVVTGRFGLLQPSVLRRVVFCAGLALRGAKRTAESIARLELLLYATNEMTLAEILVFLTSTFEDVDDNPPPEPAGPEPDILVAVLGGVAVVAGALFVVSSITNEAVPVPKCSYTRNEQQKNPYAYALTAGPSSHQEPSAPAPVTVTVTVTAPAAPPPRRAVAARFDASRAIAAWIQECEAAGINHRSRHQRRK